MLYSSLTGLAVVVALAIGGCWVLIHLARREHLLGPVTFALGTRLMLGTVMLVRSGPAVDGVWYDDQARALADYLSGTAAKSPYLNPGKEALPALLGIVYWAVGYTPVFAVVLSALLTGAVPLVIKSVCVRSGMQSAGYAAAWIVVVFPSVVFYTSAPLLRESLILLLLSFAILGVFTIRQGSLLRGGSMLLLSGALMVPSRGGLAYLILVGLPIALIANAALARPQRAILAGSLVILTAGVAIALVANQHLSQQQYFDPDRAAIVESALNEGSTSFATAKGSGAAALPFPLAKAADMASVLFGPFPWEWSNLPLLIVGIDAALWVILWALAAIALANARDRWAVLLLLGPALLIAAYLGITATNYGLIFRLRGLLLPFIAPPAALGLVLLHAWLGSHRQRIALPANGHTSP